MELDSQPDQDQVSTLDDATSSASEAGEVTQSSLMPSKGDEINETLIPSADAWETSVMKEVDPHSTKPGHFNEMIAAGLTPEQAQYYSSKVATRQQQQAALLLGEKRLEALQHAVAAASKGSKIDTTLSPTEGRLSGQQETDVVTEEDDPNEERLVKPALDYLHKIKSQCSDHLEIYDQFLNIMETYPPDAASAQKLYDQVAQLFVDKPDLLEGFKYFLPSLEVYGQTLESTLPPRVEQEEETPGRTYLDMWRRTVYQAIDLHKEGKLAESEYVLRQNQKPLREVLLRMRAARDTPPGSTQQETLQHTPQTREAEEAVRLLDELDQAYAIDLPDDHPCRLASGHILADTYLATNKKKEAIELFEHVAKVQRKDLGEDHPLRLQTEQSLAQAYLAIGQTSEAIELLEHTTTQENCPNLFASQHDLARAYLATGWTGNAIILLKDLAQEREVGEGDYEGRLAMQRDLVRAYMDVGKAPAAIKLLQQLVKQHEDRWREFSISDPTSIELQHELARAYISDGQVTAAIQLLEGLVERERKVLAEDNPSLLVSQRKLARAYMDNGQVTDALRLLEPLYDVHRPLPDYYLDRLALRHELAEAYMADNQVTAGMTMLANLVSTRKELANVPGPYTAYTDVDPVGGIWKQEEELIVIAERMRTLGKDHPDTLDGMCRLGRTCREQGGLEESERILVDVLERSRTLLGKGHRITLDIMVDLAATYEEQKRWRKAEHQYIRIMEMNERATKRDKEDFSNVAILLAQMYSKSAQWDKSAMIWMRIIDDREDMHSEHCDEDYKALWPLPSAEALALMYRSQGRLDLAERLCTRLVEAHSRMSGAEHARTLNAMVTLASVYGGQERWGEVEELCTRAFDIQKRVNGVDQAYTLGSVKTLALAYEKQERWLEAIELNAAVYKVSKRVLGDQDPSTMMAKDSILSTYGRMGPAAHLNVRSALAAKGWDLRGDGHREVLRALIGEDVSLELEDALGAAQPQQAASDVSPE